MFSTVGGGGRGEGDNEYRGGYLEYRRGVFSIVWGCQEWEDILSTVGGYLEYSGRYSVLWGVQ